MTRPSEQFDALVLRHLDGALDEASRRELEGHLRQDPVAVQRLALLAIDQIELRRLLKREGMGRAAERASQARVATQPKTGTATLPAVRPWHTRRRVLAGALAATAVLLAALWLWPSARGPQLESGHVLVNGVETSRLREGDRFKVVGEGPAVVRLADGSRAELAVSTEAVLRGTVGETRQVFELARGVGQFQVQKGKGAFRVETPSGKVTVLGTEFSVELRPAQSGGDGNMNGRSAMTLVVAVVLGSVQVDWNGGRVTLNAGQRKTFAAEGEGREGNARQPKKEGKEGDGAKGQKVTLTGLVVATTGEVAGEGGRMVTRVTAVELVMGEVTYNVKMDRNGAKLGQSFDDKEVTVNGVLVQQENGATMLVVTGIPSQGGGDKEKEGDGGRVTKEGEGDKVKEGGEGRVKKAGEGDLGKEGAEARVKKTGGDRPKEGGEGRVKRDGEGAREKGPKDGETREGDKAVDAKF
jgi:ferric-dicitrate binding protein FerR (iron transport regulator)